MMTTFRYMMTTFRFYVILRNSERRTVNGFIVQFWGYQGIRCVFAAALFTGDCKQTNKLGDENSRHLINILIYICWL